MSELTENQTCPTVGYQAATVCVPVTIEPKAVLGCPEMKCVGNPEVECLCGDCGLNIKIKQCVCLCLPVEYVFVAKTGDASIACKDCDC